MAIDFDVKEPPLPTSAVTTELPESMIITRAHVYGVYVFFSVAAFTLIKTVYDLITAAAPQIVKDPREQLAVMIAAFSVQLIQIVISVLSAMIGYLLLRAAGTSSKQVIPEHDRMLLSSLIHDEKDKGIDLYVRLSSLIGATGVFTRLGLVGLPLATIGLTLLFTGVSLGWGKEYLDLAKLTLGAFIGSYVQRQVTTSGTSEAGLKSLGKGT